MTPMSDPQRRRIFVLIRELGWNDEMRHGMLERWVGKPSLSLDAQRPITSAEATAVLRLLSAEVRSQQARRRAQKKRSRRNHPAGQPTPEQLHRLAKLRRAVFGDQDAKFRALCRRLVKTDDPRWMTARQVVTLTLALERMSEFGWTPNTPARSRDSHDSSATPADYPRDAAD